MAKRLFETPLSLITLVSECSAVNDDEAETSHWRFSRVPPTKQSIWCAQQRVICLLIASEAVKEVGLLLSLLRWLIAQPNSFCFRFFLLLSPADYISAPALQLTLIRSRNILHDLPTCKWRKQRMLTWKSVKLFPQSLLCYNNIYLWRKQCWCRFQHIGHIFQGLLRCHDILDSYISDIFQSLPKVKLVHKAGSWSVACRCAWARNYFLMNDSCGNRHKSSLWRMKVRRWECVFLLIIRQLCTPRHKNSSSKCTQSFSCVSCCAGAHNYRFRTPSLKVRFACWEMQFVFCTENKIRSTISSGKHSLIPFFRS